MKKHIILMITGVVFIAIGIVLSVPNNRNDFDEGNQVSILSKEEATSLINEKLDGLIGIYEKKEETFDVINLEEEKNEGYIEINNYDSVVESKFTKNGIKELEKTIFEGKPFILKEEDKVYLLNEIPEKNNLRNSVVTVGTTTIKEKEITSEVTFSSYAVNSDDVLTYYVIQKTIKLVKDENGWLVDSFIYNNE